MATERSPLSLRFIRREATFSNVAAFTCFRWLKANGELETIGVRWLPIAAAARSSRTEGNLNSTPTASPLNSDSHAARFFDLYDSNTMKS